jgi:cellulose synthase/poly-beta-1,6-N-acetylglucosamine synthase-like glycosyltransferase
VPRLSIIIPTQGDWEALETTLVSVLENRPPKTEIIVVVNQTYADPYDLKDEVRFVPALGRPKLVDLLNTGFAAARSEVAHVLACGATVFEGWTTAAVRRFDDPQVAAVAPLLLDAACPSRVLTAGSNWSRGGKRSSFGSGLSSHEITSVSRSWVGPDLAAAFYRRSALADLRGLDATLSASAAAVDFCLRLAASGRHCVLEADCRVALEPSRFDCDRAWREAWHDERLFWRHAGRGWLRGFPAHGWTLFAEAVQNAPRLRLLPRLAGRLIGVCDRRGRRGAAIESPAATDAMPRTDEAERRVDTHHEVQPPHRAPIRTASTTPS